MTNQINECFFLDFEITEFSSNFKAPPCRINSGGFWILTSFFTKSSSGRVEEPGDSSSILHFGVLNSSSLPFFRVC